MNLLRNHLLALTAVLAATGTHLHAQWNPTTLYRLHTLWQGDQNPLDVIEGGADDGDLRLQPRKVGDPGQYWRITPIPGAPGRYRLSSVLRGPNQPADIYNGGPKNNYPNLEPLGPFTGQYWTITPFPGVADHWRLTTDFRGPNMALDIINNGPNNQPHLTAVGNYSGQAWKITPAQLPQELYYKFERGLGDVAVNYGDAAVRSRVTGIGGAPFGTGAFGGGLRGSQTSPGDSAYCDTGWDEGFTGDFTAHWWMKERAQPFALSHVFGDMDANSFRGYTGGVAGTGFRVQFASGDTIDLPLVGDSLQVRARATAGLFLGLRVEGMTAQWFVDGAPHGAPVTLAFTPTVARGARGLKIGRDTDNTFSSVYDLDEFRLMTRAAADAELAAWAQAPSAAAGAYGSRCGIDLSSAGGPPQVGNAGYTHAIAGAANMSFLFVLGIPTQPGFDMGIAFPALSGCTWYAAFNLDIVSATNASGDASLPGSIPNTPGLAGIGFDTQVLGFAGNQEFQSNAVSHRIEMQ